ncbi:MAG: ComEA family DNA-binding protein [Lachnospiraceae bacterium]|nr:ComEA family DNA-binding protein [Lachnospiraceae bacterium]
MKNTKLVSKVSLLFFTGLLVLTSACGDTAKKDTLLFISEQEATEYLQDGGEEPFIGVKEQRSAESTVGQTDTVFVHICGEVISPGVYEVSAGSRIYDVLQLAGGFTDEAAEEYLNLAAPVTDGMQIVILSEEEAAEEKERQRKEDLGLVNINTASVEELCTLPGIGESRAADIVAYRTANGNFKEPQDIMQVNGIKSALYEKLKDKICVE